MSTQDAMGAAHDQARLSRLRYVHGDYADPETFSRLKNALGDARRPIHYLKLATSSPGLPLGPVG